MEREFGKGVTTALEKRGLATSGALNQQQAMHILKLVYPDVPEDQIIRTAILCRDFGLHPLMKEVYIIGFQNHKTGKTDYSTVIGITANRKMAANKKGAFSFLDDTPRVASKEEIIKQYGENSEEERDNLISICKLKGETGNEAIGFGLWPKNKEPYGTDKGNTKRNMANIRSERQALDRLPGEALPLRDIEVLDTTYLEVPEVGKVDTSTGEITEAESEHKEHWCQEHQCPFEKKIRGSSVWYAHKLPDGSWCNEVKKKEAKGTPTPDAAAERYFTPPEPEPAPAKEVKGFIDIDWLNESLTKLRATNLTAWTESNLLGYMKTIYKVEAKTVLEAAVLLDQGQAAHFVKRVEDTLEMA